MKRAFTLIGAIILAVAFTDRLPAASTVGTNTFTVTLTDPPTNYTAYVDAYWITDSAGKWVQTIRRDAGTRINYLRQWTNVTAGVRTVDGYTGATISGSGGTYTVMWDGRDTNNMVVSDGDYRFFVEMTDHNGQGYWTTNGLLFTKGTVAYTTNFPNPNPYMTGMSCSYVPDLRHDIAIAAVSPATAQTSSVVNITVTVTNKAAYTESFSVTLTNMAGGVIGTRLLNNLLGASGSNVVFAWNTAGLPIGGYVLSASADAVIGETNIANNLYTHNITLVPTPHDIAVLSITPRYGFTNIVTPVRVMVTNQTTTTETFTLVVSNVTSGSLIISQQVANLPGNRATNVLINWDSVGMIAGDYQLQATAGPVIDEMDPSDNTLTADITMRLGLPDLAVLRINSPAMVLSNAATPVTVLVTNRGDLAVSSTVRLFEDTEGRQLGSFPINLQPGNGANLTFTWRTTNSAYGYHILRAVVLPVANELEIADNTNTLAVAMGLRWATNTFVAKGSRWAFHDRGIDLGATPWKQPDYYDGAWSNSPAPLGYSTGTPPQNTNMNYVMSYGPDANNRYPTYYLRTTFDADSLPTNLVLNVRRDDGVIFYLNDIELVRHNMPTGTVSYATFAPLNVIGEGQYAYFRTNVSPGAMILGKNVLAAELHQSTANSADIVLDAELFGTTPVFPTNNMIDVIALASTGDVVEGDRMGLSVTVTNRGPLPENVLVVIRDAGTGEVVGTKQITGVAAGDSTIAQIDWSTLGASSGTHNLQAFTVIKGQTNLAGTFNGSATITGSGFGLNAVSASGAIGGRCGAVAASSNLLVVGAGATLETWSRGGTGAPVKVGAVRLPGAIEHLAISGSWVFAACGNAGVHIIDATVPAEPLHSQSFSSSGNAHGVAVSGNNLYVADGVAGLRIINIANPNNPSLAGVYYTEGPARAVAAVGSTVYVLDGHQGLLVLNASNPRAPVLTGSYAGFDAGQAIAVNGSYAYAVDGNNRFYVFNIGSPSPALASTLLVPNLVGRSLAVNGTTVYIAGGDSGLLIANASAPSAPVIASTIPTPGACAALALSGGALYVANELAGFEVFDASTGGSPALQYDLPAGIRAADVALAGNLAYVAAGEAGLRIYNVTNPASPVWVGWFTQATNARAVAVSGSTAYVGDGQYGLKIVNVATPASPALLGIYSNAELSHIRSVGCTGSLVVLSDGRKVQLVNAGNPAAPTLVGSFSAPAFVFGMAVVDGRVYLACGDAGLVILSASQATPLSVLGSYNTPGLASGVSVSGSLAHVADGNGWLMLDVANPASPSLVKSNVGGEVTELTVTDNLVSLATSGNQVQSINVSVPVAPVPVRSFGPLVQAMRMAALGTLVAVAEDDAGVALLSNGNDQDQDGLPDGWEQQVIDASLATNGPIRTLRDVTQNGDFDGDGLSNYAEYVAGTSPVSAASRFAAFVPSLPTNGAITLSWPSLPGKIYSVYQTTDLGTGFTLVRDNIVSTPGTNVTTIPISAPGTFYLIGVR